MNHFNSLNRNSIFGGVGGVGRPGFRLAGLPVTRDRSSAPRAAERTPLADSARPG